MSLSAKNLSAVQKAGHAVHDASEAIASTVKTQAESLVARMATQPYSAESDQVIARFKSLSGLSQGLIAVEAKLRELYATALELSSAASDVIILPSIKKKSAASNAAAVDVVAKPVKATKKIKAPRRGRKAAALTANDNKLLQYLQGALKSGEPTAVTGAAMTAGSGIPLGSLGVSIKKLVAAGAIAHAGRGMYQLGIASIAPTSHTATAASSDKKVKVRPAKNAKAKKTDITKVNPLKTKAPKKSKAAPAKKAAAPATPIAETTGAVAEAAPL